MRVIGQDGISLTVFCIKRAGYWTGHYQPYCVLLQACGLLDRIVSALLCFVPSVRVIGQDSISLTVFCTKRAGYLTGEYQPYCVLYQACGLLDRIVSALLCFVPSVRVIGQDSISLTVFCTKRAGYWTG